MVLSLYTDRGGGRFTLSNDRITGVRTRTDPLGRQETTSYDPRTRLTLRREDAAGFEESFAWDFTRGLLLEHRRRGDPSTDADDRVTAFGWHPSRAWLTSVTEKPGRPEERRTELAYTPEGFVRSVRLGGAAERSFSWTESGALRSVRDETARVVDFESDPSTGNTLAIHVGGLTWEFERNGWGAFTSITRPGPDRPTRRLELDAVGRILRVTDELGHATTYVRLPSGRLSEIHDAKTPPAVTRIDYDAAGRAEVVHYADGATEVFTYGPSGDIVEHRDRRGWRLNYDYDAGRRLLRVREGTATRLEYGYDDLDGLVWARADESEIEFERSPFGDILRERETASNAGHEVAYQRDGLGRVEARSLSIGGRPVFTERFAHNARDQRTAVTASGGVAGAIAPFAVSATFEHDAAGRAVRAVTSGGVESRSSHDALGRLIERSTVHISVLTAARTSAQTVVQASASLAATLSNALVRATAAPSRLKTSTSTSSRTARSSPRTTPRRSASRWEKPSLHRLAASPWHPR
jgi:YD repeat-containing protein